MLANWPTQLVHSQELKFPQIIKIRYEALNPRVGGQFIIWVEREKIWYGLDSKIFPAARSVDVTYVTPAPGSTTITFIAVTGVNSTRRRVSASSERIHRASRVNEHDLG